MKVAIIGAGSIGCYVGAALAADGADVAFLGREAKGKLLTQSGITSISLDGNARDTAKPQWKISPQQLVAADLYLLCVKSQDTEQTALSLKKVIPAGANIVSLQNGLNNHDILLSVFGKDAHVFSSVVVFNVVENPTGTFKATTEGGIYLQSDPRLEDLGRALNAANIETNLRDDIKAVAYAKLLLNLNNALNALSGLPLAEQLRDRSWRLVLAAMMDEGLAIAKKMKQPVPKIGKVKQSIIPTILRLPTPLFTRIASAMLKIDPAARSSMADDLGAGRKPEVDYLNGTLVELGKQMGVPTPVNQRVTRAVHTLFNGTKNTPSPKELLRG